MLEAKIPSVTNTIVNPSTKAKEFFMVLDFFLLLFSPEKYIMYIGNIGNTHGEIKDIIPSKNDIKYGKISAPNHSGIIVACYLLYTNLGH